MYLNQFTNTKRIWYGRASSYYDKKRLQWIHVKGGRRKKIPSIAFLFVFFFLLQKWHEIYYSILFQPAKWVLQGFIIQKGGKKKKERNHSSTKNCPSPPTPELYSISTFAEIFTGFTYIHPLLSIESHFIQVTRDHKKNTNKKTPLSEPTKVMLLFPQSDSSSGCSGMKENLSSFFLYLFTNIYKIFFYSFNHIGIYFNNK